MLGDMSTTGLAAQGRAAMRLRRAATCRCGRQVAAGEPAGVDPLTLAPVCSWCLDQVPAQRADAAAPSSPR
jgi:hypothetical protein